MPASPRKPFRQSGTRWTSSVFPAGERVEVAATAGQAGIEPMREGRTFESRDSERRFYRMLARFEAAGEPMTEGSILSRAALGARRLVERRWLTFRLAASIRRHTR